MSSPVQNDLDKRTMYVPPWARDASDDGSEAVLAAIERLRNTRQRVSPQERDKDSRQEQARETPPPQAAGDIEVAMGEIVRETWSPPSLEPVAMPTPPKPKFSGPTWAMATRMCGAVGFAAAVALFVTGAVPLPSIDISLTKDAGANAASATVQAVGVRGPRQPVMIVPDQPIVGVLPAFAPTATVGVAAAAPLALPETSSSVVPRQSAPEPRVLEREEIAVLVQRGEELVAQGDISSGRLLLRRAAEAGEAQASLALAGTYDPAVLATLKVVGVAPDRERARSWYAKAAEQGSTDAARRLEQLAQRSD